jgi:hypothetical protein
VQLGTASSLDLYGSPSGTEPACSRERAEVFHRWPGQLVSRKNPRVRGEVGIANPFGSIISSQESTISSNIFLSRRSPSKTTTPQESS